MPETGLPATQMVKFALIEGGYGEEAVAPREQYQRVWRNLNLTEEIAGQVRWLSGSGAVTPAWWPEFDFQNWHCVGRELFLTDTKLTSDLHMYTGVYPVHKHTVKINKEKTFQLRLQLMLNCPNGGMDLPQTVTGCSRCKLSSGTGMARWLGSLRSSIIPEDRLSCH